ncbi:MAG TPA: FecR domain-containing protein, partial [Verrucomicrobiae bacterium]|nr:FecR domain-containing protein [Verrucomicrobiae bacterium]
MREEDEPLFSRRGALPDDLARLERALSTLPLPPEPDWDAPPRRERRSPALAWAAAAAVLLVAFAGLRLAGDAWRVEPLAGSPSLGGVAFAGRVALGGRVSTDAHSRARLEVKGLGVVELEPGSVLRRVRGRGSERKLALDHGTLHAFIQAPPRQFIVETPVGVATDLG